MLDTGNQPLDIQASSGRERLVYALTAIASIEVPAVPSNRAGEARR